MTQRFEVRTAARQFEVESFKGGICRAIDASWRAADLAIDIDMEGEPSANSIQTVTVAVKVRRAQRHPETPTTEATAEDIEALFAGFEADPASAGAALDVDLHKVHAPKTEHGRFGDAALQAAFDCVRITFVGPSGERSKLERAALRIPDLRLRCASTHRTLNSPHPRCVQLTPPPPCPIIMQTGGDLQLPRAARRPTQGRA